MKNNFDLVTIYESALLFAIAHAVTVPVYPEFSYEISWDGNNFSFNDSSGIRGTIAFTEDMCFAGIRNYCHEEINISEVFDLLSPKLQRLALDETLQYLLVSDGKPSLNAVFWVENDSLSIYESKEYLYDIGGDFVAFFFKDHNEQITYLQEYYDMNEAQLALVLKLYNAYKNTGYKGFILDPVDFDFLASSGEMEDCLESLAELNIYAEN